jgi:hypothetical protein
MPDTPRTPHPGLTFRVYRIDPLTRRRTEVLPLTEVPPAGTPDLTSAWAPCACPRCAGPSARRHPPSQGLAITDEGG